VISHLGPQFGVADGIALGNLLKINNQVCAVLLVMVVQVKEIFMKL